MNGMKSPDGKDTFGNVKLEVVPGDYHLAVSFSGKSSTLVQALKAEPGHTYLVTSTHDNEKSTWNAIVRDETEDRIVLKEGPFPLNTIRTGDDQDELRRYGP